MSPTQKRLRREAREAGARAIYNLRQAVAYSHEAAEWASFAAVVKDTSARETARDLERKRRAWADKMQLFAVASTVSAARFARQSLEVE